MDIQAEERPTTAERWRDVRRNNLLDAASRIFARQGYDAASLEDIAFEAGIGKPTIYRYFPSKEALFEAAFGYALDDLEIRLDAALALPGTFEQRLIRLITSTVTDARADEQHHPEGQGPGPEETDGTRHQQQGSERGCRDPDVHGVRLHLTGTRTPPRSPNGATRADVWVGDPRFGRSWVSRAEPRPGRPREERRGEGERVPPGHGPRPSVGYDVPVKVSATQSAHCSCGARPV